MDISNIFLNSNKTIAFKPNIVFNYIFFRKMFLNNLDYLEKNLYNLKKTVCTIFENPNIPVDIRVSNIYGEEFFFNLFDKKLFIWNHCGNQLIYSIKLDDNLKERKKQLYLVMKKMEKFTEQH